MRLHRVLLCSALITVAVHAAETQPGGNKLIAQLAGKWKEDLSKHKMGSGLDLRFKTNAAGELEELRGPEARPIVQPVRFDGKTRELEDGNTIAWKQLDANKYERTLTLKGKLISNRRLQVSSDWKTITEEFEGKQPDGKTLVRTTVYKRSSGDAKSLAGTWKRESVRVNIPSEVTFQPAGSNALKVSGTMGTGAYSMYTLHLDGKESPITGEGVIPDMMIFGRQVDENTRETKTTRQGVATGKGTLKVSEGGKVITLTNQSLGPNSSGGMTVMVFNKQ